VQALLAKFVARQPLPRGSPLYQPAPPPGGAPQQSLAGYAASATLSLFTMPYRAARWMLSYNYAGSVSPLADASLLLLLVLVHEPVPGAQPGAPASGSHPYRAALHGLQDSAAREPGQAAEAAEGGSSAAMTSGRAKASFSGIYQCLGGALVDEKVTLLLYSLLQGCAPFREYLLCRGDLDRLLLPLLEMLYHLPQRTNSHIYMLLIVLLILSQDKSFAQNVHKQIIPAVPWYKERLLHNVSLGSLLVTLLLRTAQYNLNKLQDVYLQTNTLAALANLAPHMSGLSSYAAQRLVQLLDIILRKINK
jgi:dymeclin